jgi:3-dehydroquinate dehydratase / shikimate dehydrogenase
MIILVSKEFEIEAQGADIIEWRVEKELPLEELLYKRKKLRVPLLLTCPSSLHMHLIEILQPEYVDLPYDMPVKIIRALKNIFPSIKWILSYHNYALTPLNLEEIVHDMQKIKADYYKMATFCHTTTDALRLLHVAKKNSGLTAQGMGKKGEITRILASVLEMPFVYAIATEASRTVAGQLLISTLVTRYHFKAHAKKTAIYGLIGNPVHLSVSDKTHNLYFAVHNIEAIYVKMELLEEELTQELLMLLQDIGFKGLSITMPFKEKIISLVDMLSLEAEKSQSVNTITFTKEGIKGDTTDGTAIKELLEKELNLKKSHILLLGTGGAALSIAHALASSCASLTIAGREGSKAEAIADRLNAKALRLRKLSVPLSIDAVINCTPISPEIAYSRKIVVIDIRIDAKNHPFLQQAENEAHKTFSGWNMFSTQAKKQFSLWFK